MTYCQKCGTKNDDDADFCKKCGASLKGDRKSIEKEWENRCDEECHSGPTGSGWSIFWGVIIVLVGLWVIFEFVIKKIPVSDLPQGFEWLVDFPFGFIIAAVVGIFIIFLGLRIIGKNKKN